LSDVGEMFDRAESQQRRKVHRDHAPSVLAMAGIPFVSKNGAAHLIVGEPPLFDFWPGTGLYRGRGTSVQGRGIRNLIAAYRKATGATK
jgi:hypothetical protein